MEDKTVIYERKTRRKTMINIKKMLLENDEKMKRK